MTTPDDPAPPLAPDWRASLTAQLECLDRWFRDRFLPEPGPEMTAIAATRFLDLDFLRDFLHGLASLPGDTNVPGPRRDAYLFTIAASGSPCGTRPPRPPSRRPGRPSRPSVSFASTCGPGFTAGT
jgi:hypothetical protein